MARQSFKKILRELFNAWAASAKILKQKQALFPFVITVLFEVIALVVIYYSPRYPLSIIFGPPIKRFWGEIYLHYPYNFVLMPKLLFYAENLTDIFVGGLMSAVVACFIFQSKEQHNAPKLASAFKKVLPRYFSILITAALNFILVILIYKLQQKGMIKIFAANPEKKILLLGAAEWVQIGYYLTILIGVAAQTLLIYVIPIIAIESKNIFKAIWLGLLFSLKNFGISFLAVLIPIIVYMPMLILRNNLVIIMDKFMPEAALYVLLIGILLMALVNFWIIASITYVYLAKRKTTV